MTVLEYEHSWQRLAWRIRDLNRSLLAAFGPHSAPNHITDLVAEAIGHLDRGELAECQHSCSLAEIAVERQRQ